MSEPTKPAAADVIASEATADVRTFLFADIRGYTRFTHEHGDEAAASLVARFVALVREIAEARGGQLLELRGDEALVVFTSARRALRAAVELQARFAHQTQVDPTLPLSVGIGLDAGEAVPVEGGYRGEALNLAARLCQLAGAGEVLASDAVVHLAGRLKPLAYVERGRVQLKGLAEPVQVMQVAPLPDVEEDTPALATPQVLDAGAPVRAEVALPLGGFLGALPTGLLVARDAEVARIFAAVDAVAEGCGQVVMLAGEPGVGKTRLAQEAMLSARNRRFLVATGRCYEARQMIPYYPFLDALAEVYAACPEAARADVPRRWPYLVRLVPDLDLMGSGASSPGQEEQERLFRAVTGFLLAIAAESPVTLLLDDLHWADGASLDLFQHLARHTRSHRVLLLATYRDVEVGRQHPLERVLRDLHREKLLDEVAIHRLGSEGTAALAAATLGVPEVSTDLAGLVHRHTDGNAFFIQEVLHALIERGDVFQRDGRWEQRAVQDIEVPRSVRSAIGERLACLPERAQEIVLEASVLGQTFAFDLLQAMTGQPEAEIEDALQGAAAAGMVREAGRDNYAFNHALMQQAFYAELSSRKKRRLHRAAGEAMERLPELERVRRAAELAWHFLEGDDSEGALRYTLIAGAQAEAVFARGEAERHYSTALELAQQLGDRDRETEALTRRARLLLDAFDGRAAARDYELLLAGARHTGDRQAALEAMLGLGGAYYVLALDATGEDFVSRYRDQYKAAYLLARDLDDKRGMIRALIPTQWFADFWPEYDDEVRENLREALVLSQELGDEELILDSKLAGWKDLSMAEMEAWEGELLPHLQARRDLVRLDRLHFARMWQHLSWGNFEQALRSCDAGIQIASEIGVPPVQYPTLRACALLGLGRYGDAWQALQQEIADDAHPFGRAMRDLGIGIYYFELLMYERAASVLRGVIEQAARLNRAWMVRDARVLLAAGLIRAGHLDAVERDATSVYRASIVRSTLLPPVLPELLLAEGRLDAALQEAEADVARTQEAGYRPDQVGALEAQLRILLSLGRSADALALAEDSLRLAQEMGYLPMVWRIQEARARALAALVSPSAASEAWSSAARTIQQLAGTIGDLAHRQEFLSSARIVSVLDAGQGHEDEPVR